MQTIKLNLIPGGVLPVVNVSQYDVGRQFAIQVYDGAASYSLTGKSVQIRGTKPDGNGFAYDSTDGAISVSGNTVTITTLQQMTACGGDTTVELRITASGVVLGTLNFILAVETSALSDDTPISDTDIPAIERDFQAALDEAEADALVAEGWAKETQDGVPVTSGSPYYHKSAYYNKQIAEASATTAGTNALKSEGYAVGTQNGTAVSSGSPYYENNAKYYAERAAASVASGTQVDFYVSGGHLYVQQTIQGVVQPAVDLGPIGSASAIADLTDVDLTSLADGDYLRYNSTAQMWEVSHAVTDNLAAVENVLGAKNLFNNTAVTTTSNAVTFTINADKTVSTSGTASDGTPFTLGSVTLSAGDYILSGCPAGGSANSYKLRSTDGTINDYGNGASFTLSQQKTITIMIGVPSGINVTGKVFKPMIRPAAIEDDTYVPYAMTNRELTDAVDGITTWEDITDQCTCSNGTLNVTSSCILVNKKLKLASLMFTVTSITNQGNNAAFVVLPSGYSFGNNDGHSNAPLIATNGMLQTKNVVPANGASNFLIRIGIYQRNIYTLHNHNVSFDADSLMMPSIMVPLRSVPS